MAHFAKINTDNIVVEVIVVNDNELLVDGYHYRAEFTSKDYDSAKDSDFMPPEL